MKQFDYTITDELGIHARPAGIFVREASKYASSVTISKGDKKADAKKIFGVMGLAVKCGETITVTIEGSDEETAFTALNDFMASTL